jgi:Uma2 family endonuclease
MPLQDASVCILGHAPAPNLPEEDVAMPMAHHAKKWTLEELHSLPDDGNKYELIRGQLFVTPAPKVSHETILARLTRILEPYVVANGLGYVYHPRAVIRVADDTEVEPDLMVRQPPEDETVDWTEVPAPILVIEVVSDSTRRRDRVQKLGLYTDIRIPEYWIVDGDDRTIRALRLGRDDVVADDTLVWHPAGAELSLVIGLAEVFAPRKP